MKYPDIHEVTKASRYQICLWYRRLPSPGATSIQKGKDAFYDAIAEETLVLELITERFKELGGFTTEISKQIVAIIKAAMVTGGEKQMKLSNYQAHQLYLIAVNSLNFSGPMGLNSLDRQTLVDEIINQQDGELVELDTATKPSTEEE